MSMRVMSREEFRHARKVAGWVYVGEVSRLPDATALAHRIHAKTGREVALVPARRNFPGLWSVAVLAPDLMVLGLSVLEWEIPPLPAHCREVVA